MNFKKAAVLGLAVMSLAGFQGVSEAAYTLNEEVKNPTPALLQASAIGVRANENAELANLPDKDAILVMSFGTTFKETREKTIDATVKAIQDAHPGVKVVTAFTSHIIVDRIKANEGITYPTPEEALAQLKAEGYTRVAMTSLDIIPGMEYSYDEAVYNLHKNDFKKASLGTSLMYWQGQEEQPDDVAEFVEAVKTQFPKLGKKDALLLMAHGTPHPANAYYSVLQNRLDEADLGNVLVYSVEGWPHLDTVIPMLKAKGVKNVTLQPMMMVAGDHANNDMAGDEEDSHKVILQGEGFKVTPDIRGLGENEAIRKLFVERAHDAYEALIETPEQKTIGEG